MGALTSPSLLSPPDMSVLASLLLECTIDIPLNPVKGYVDAFDKDDEEKQSKATVVATICNGNLMYIVYKISCYDGEVDGENPRSRRAAAMLF
jgi:hypothetical protein